VDPRDCVDKLATTDLVVYRLSIEDLRARTKYVHGCYFWEIQKQTK